MRGGRDGGRRQQPAVFAQTAQCPALFVYALVQGGVAATSAGGVKYGGGARYIATSAAVQPKIRGKAYALYIDNNSAYRWRQRRRGGAAKTPVSAVSEPGVVCGAYGRGNGEMPW